MAGNVIQEFVIALGFDASGVSQGIGQAVSSVGAAANRAETKVSAASRRGSKEFQNLGKSGERAGQVIIKALSAINPVLSDVAQGVKHFGGALLGAFGAAKLFNNYVEKSDGLGKLSQQLGVSEREIDAWSKANEAAGGSAEALQQSLKSFFDATGRPADEFFHLGEKIEGMSRRQAQLYLRAQGVAQDAIPVFLKGQREAERLVAKYRKTAFTAQDAQNARRYKVAWNDFKIAAQDVGNVFVRAVLPPITAALKVLESVVSVVRDNIGAFSVLGGMLSASLGITAMGKVSRAIVGVSRELRGLSLFSGAFFSGFAKNLRQAIIAVRLFGISLKAAFLPLTLATAAVAALFLVIEDLFVFMKGGDSVFGDLLSNLGMTADEVKGIQNSLKTVGEMFGRIWEAVKPFLKGVLTVAVKAFCIALVPVMSVLAGIVAGVTKGVGMVKAFFGAFIDGAATVVDWINGIGDWFGTAFDNALSAVRDFFSSWFDIFVEAVLNPIKGALSGVWGGIKAFFGVRGEEGSASPSRQAQAVAGQAAQYSNSNTVTTNATMNVTNNIATRDNPQAIGAAVGNTVSGMQGQWGQFATQSSRALYRR